MEKHQYCCQNTAQNYLDHIIPVPDDFNVNPACLSSGMTRQEFIAGIKVLTDIIKNIYADMIQNPAEYGLPLIDDIEYKPFNPKAAESKNSSHRLISLLHTLVQCGEFSGREISANIKVFSEACKKLKSMYKISNSNMIFKKLLDFGFAVDGFNGKAFDKKAETFTLSYIDDGNVVSALYCYMKNNALRKNDLFSLNYHLAIAQEDLPANNHQLIFAEYLSGNEREFYRRFNERMESEGFIEGNSGDYSDYAIEYLINSKKEKRIVRCYSDYGKLLVCLKLHNSGSYAEYTENLPERIKQIFRKESTCRFCVESCGARLTRTFEGITYTDCGYIHSFDIVCYEPDDIEKYMQLILLEIKALKAKKK